MIGIFDSGRGGLCTLEACIRAGARGTYIYYADTNSAPFGNKSQQQIRFIAQACVRQLRLLGCSLAVCACNTASLACSPFLGFELPTLGLTFPTDILPQTNTLFLGTRYSAAHLPKSLCDYNLHSLALEDLATLTDRNADAPEIDYYLRKMLCDYVGADTVILGCTHFGIHRQNIADVLKCRRILDMNSGIALRLADITKKEEKPKVLFLKKQAYLMSELRLLLGDKADYALLAC